MVVTARPRASRRATVAVGVLAAVTAALAGSACGGKAKATSPAPKLHYVAANFLPTDVLGLSVHEENDHISPNVKKENLAYVNAVGLFSFRRGDLLQATLQVSELTKKAASRGVHFESTVLQQVLNLSREPAPFRIEGHRVFLTTGEQQSVAVWFGGHRLYLLTVRSDFTQPRSLLREVIRRVAT